MHISNVKVNEMSKIAKNVFEKYVYSKLDLGNLPAQPVSQPFNSVSWLKRLYAPPCDWSEVSIALILDCVLTVLNSTSSTHE
jgi:hypothetical protein